MNIRKGDEVVIISGKHKGYRGKVLRVLPKKERLVVEGANMIKRHQRPTSRNTQGGVLEREGTIHVSNVMPWCSSLGKPSKIVMKRLEDGQRVRVFKANGEMLND